MSRQFSIYSQKLEPIASVKLAHIVDGLDYTIYLTHSTDTKSSRLAVLARILNIEKVETNSTKHSYVCETRRGGGDCLLVEFDLLTQKMRKTPASSSIQCKS